MPAGFDADLAANKQPQLTVYVNNQKTIFEQAAFRRLLDQLVRSFAKQPEPARLVWVDESSPASLNEIITGKALTGVVYTLLIAGLLLGINRQSIQSWPLTMLTIVVGLLFVVGVGLVIGSVLKNTMQVNTWASIVLIVLSEALKLSMAGTVSSQLWLYLAVLLGCTVIVFFAATWALHRRS